MTLKLYLFNQPILDEFRLDKEKNMYQLYQDEKLEHRLYEDKNRECINESSKKIGNVSNKVKN